MFAGLSMVSGWWLLPTMVTAFVAGRRPGRTGPTVLALVAVLAAGVLVFSVVPGWLSLASRFLIVFVTATMSPWFAGRFWRQYQDLLRAGWERAEQVQREQRLVAGQARLRERARIAQDMHDLLGHDLSLLALSAGALKLAPGLEEHHREAAAELRARAAVAVERIEYGPHRGGFAVTARIPHAPVPPPVTPWIDRALPQEHRRARRRLGRTLVTAVMVPLVTGALLSGALAGWETLSASQAVLTPGDYARLRIGQDRSALERHLPRRQTRHRPLTADPTGKGLTCEFYAMTADRFDDRSGDVYRLCFRDDVLVSRDTITP